MITTEEKATHAGAELKTFEIDPQFVQVDELLSGLRDRSTARYKASVEALAKRIDEAGQNTPCVVREGPDGYVLIAGQRRLEAVKQLREAGNEDVLLVVTVNETVRTPADNHYLACSENFDREGFTPIEKAKIIRGLRLDNDWTGKAGDVQVGNYLGLKPTTVTQLERLLKLPESLQEQVESGALSVSSALELAGVKAEKVAAVVDKAVEKAAAAAVDRDDKAESKAKVKAAGKAPNPTPKVPVVDVAAVREKERVRLEKVKAKAAEIKAGAKGAPKVEEKHVRAATREVEGAVEKQKAPKLGELLEVVQGWVLPVYPAVMQKLARAVVEFGHGRQTVQQVQACWEDVADCVAPGDPKTGPITIPLKPKAKASVKAPTASKHKAKATAKAPTKAKSKKPATKPAPKKAAKGKR